MIQIFDGYITLPSGRMLPLDALQTFTPNDEFWWLWRQEKQAVLDAGVGICREERTNEWRGFIRENTEFPSTQLIDATPTEAEVESIFEKLKRVTWV